MFPADPLDGQVFKVNMYVYTYSIFDALSRTADAQVLLFIHADECCYEVLKNLAREGRGTRVHNSGMDPCRALIFCGTDSGGRSRLH